MRKTLAECGQGDATSQCVVKKDLPYRKKRRKKSHQEKKLSSEGGIYHRSAEKKGSRNPRREGLGSRYERERRSAPDARLKRRPNKTEEKDGPPSVKKRKGEARSPSSRFGKKQHNTQRISRVGR